jgi:hypothetical protein
MIWKDKTLWHMDKNLIVKHEYQMNPQNLGQMIKMYHEKVITREQGYYEAREIIGFLSCVFTSTYVPKGEVITQVVCPMDVRLCSPVNLGIKLRKLGLNGKL